MSFLTGDLWGTGTDFVHEGGHCSRILLVKGQVVFNVSTTADMLGKTVTMYIEKPTILSDSKVLGVSTKDDVNVINATAATQSTVKDYLKGTGVAVTKGTEFYVNYGYSKTEEDAQNLIND